MAGNSLNGINLVRDTLRQYLSDPYVLAGGRERANWIFTDDPFSSATYPRIKLNIQDHTASPMDIGPNYMNWEQVVVRITFFTKNDFKVSIDGVTYSNEQLVYKYENEIHDVLKSKFNDLYSGGVKGFRLLSMGTPAFSSEYMSHTGYIIVRFWLFRR